MASLIIAALLTVIFFHLHERIGLNRSDEGFLWNGSKRTSAGLIPIRDFKSYDPGRFYWVSFWSRFFGDGIIGVRKSVALFQFIGLAAGLDVLSRVYGSWISLSLMGVLLLWWMHPRHKRFEHAISLMCIWMAIQLFENSGSLPYYFAAGIFIGFSAFMGRNHGVYAFLSFTVFFITLNIGADLQQVLFRGLNLGAGIVLGYSPMLLMWLFIPQMFNRYFTDKVNRLVKGKVLKHVRLEFPWPWRVVRTNQDTIAFINNILLGVLFILLPVFYICSVVYVFASGLEMDIKMVILFVSAIVGIFYLHHGLIRADLHHLCQITQPFVVLVLTIVAMQNEMIAAALISFALVALSILLVIPFDSRVDIYRFPERYSETKIGNDSLRIDAALAKEIDTISEFVDRHLTEEETLFVAPDFPVIYPILGKMAPVFSDYLLFPETEQKQLEMIDDLKSNNVRCFLISNHPQDGKDELRFSNTHDLVWQYLVKNYQVQLTGQNILPAYQFYLKNTQAS